jgi:hypothetical protein
MDLRGDRRTRRVERRLRRPQQNIMTNNITEVAWVSIAVILLIWLIHTW